MTRVCLVGDADVTLHYELLSRETSREALSTYDLRRPFENSLAVSTVSLGSAISLCNDLRWYIVRFVDDVLIQEPSVSETEWLSHNLAADLRSDTVQPAETGEYLKVYGLEDPSDRADSRTRPPGADRTAVETTESSQEPRGATGDQRRATTESSADDGTDGEKGSTTAQPPRLVEPLYVRRTDGEIPDYDLRDVSGTLVVRLTEEEYAP